MIRNRHAHAQAAAFTPVPERNPTRSQLCARPCPRPCPLNPERLCAHALAQAAAFTPVPLRNPTRSQLCARPCPRPCPSRLHRYSLATELINVQYFFLIIDHLFVSSSNYCKMNVNILLFRFVIMKKLCKSIISTQQFLCHF